MKLRPLHQEDVHGLLEWMHDEAVYKQFKQAFETFTRTDVLKFIQTGSNEHNHHFAVVDEDDVYLGTVSLKNIDYITKTAEFAIVIRRSAWGRGGGSYAINSILKHAKVLGLESVYLRVLDQNSLAVHLYEKFKFKHCPDRDESILLRGNQLTNRYYIHELE